MSHGSDAVFNLSNMEAEPGQPAGIAWVAVALAIGLGRSLTGRCASADLVITHAKLISPPSTVIENATIVITGGKIGFAGPDQTSVATAKRVIDARGRAVIPGLIDTHVHLNLDNFESQALYDEWIQRRAPAQLREYLKRGFTTIQSLADYWPGVLGKLCTGGHRCSRDTV